MDDIREYFEHIFTLDDVRWNEFKQYLKVRNYKRKEVILPAGDTEYYFSFVLSGSVGYFMNTGERDVCFEILLDKEFFLSLFSFIKGVPSEFAIHCFEDTKVISIHKQHFLSFFSAEQTRKEVKELSAEAMMIRLQKRVISLTCESVDERYRSLLQKNPKIVQRIPLIHIASYLGITHETLSRVRKRYSQDTD